MKTLFSILLASVCLIADAQEIMFSNTPFIEGEEHLNTTKLDFVDTEPIYGLVIVPKDKVYHEFDGYSANVKVRTDWGSFPKSTYIVRGDNAYIYMDINGFSYLRYSCRPLGCFKQQRGGVKFQR